MKVGFACGVFDVFHAGHVLMLRECKQQCDYLIVAVNRGENISGSINPGKRSPVFPFDQRKMVIESIRYVDEVVEYNSENELYELMKSRKIDVRFLGDDYRDKPITGDDLEIPIYYIDRSHGYSTTRAIEAIVKSLKGK